MKKISKLFSLLICIVILIYSLSTFTTFILILSILLNSFKILRKYGNIVTEVSCINLYSDSFKLSYLSLQIDRKLGKFISESNKC